MPITVTLDTEAEGERPAMYLVKDDWSIIGHLEERGGTWAAFVFTGWKSFGWEPVGTFTGPDAKERATAAVVEAAKPYRARGET
jgi:hypothetical protein